MKGFFLMKKLSTILIVSVFVLFCGAAISGSALAASLDNYLNNNMGTIGNVVFNAASQDVMSGGNSSSDTGTRSYGSTMGKAHKYLAYGTIVAAVAAGVSGSDDGFHKGAGNAAAVFAVATCVTGFMEYSDYFDMDEGLSMHNIHIVIGTLATVGFVVTAIDANDNDDDGHAGLGIGSGVLMVVPIVVLHF
jgi:hypothetical protein